MDFGTNLRNLRISRGLTQQKLANDMNVSQASITAYENNVREPAFATVRKFADYFHVPPSQLMPFGNVSNDEEVMRFAEAIHSNEKLKILFERLKNLDETDLDAMFTVFQIYLDRLDRTP